MESILLSIFFIFHLWLFLTKITVISGFALEPERFQNYNLAQA
ncbi:hypothetical protein M983_2697 [Proteus myxofaciens ATCC 19692]|uniref:Uncharacterized protein n=1 Tax=Proteus myxofaciens ATCC 19692 TaxID=1354337 RepID=A0A198FFW7_9GAMM|nr:hypothetical protein M983_2697 [Proteus myxofaciens ATCC 19692]